MRHAQRHLSFGHSALRIAFWKRPFEGKSPTEILQRIVHQQPSPFPDSIPPALRNLVEKALEKEPGDRYQSVREIVVDLRRVTRRTEPGSEIAASVPPGLTRGGPAGGFLLQVLSLLQAWSLRSFFVGAQQSPRPENCNVSRLCLLPAAGFLYPRWPMSGASQIHQTGKR